MHKIFKYKWNPETGEVEMPEKAIILRADHVDDGFYLGNFVWAIVDTKDPIVFRKLEIPPSYSLVEEPDFLQVNEYQLSVKEKQDIWVGKPVFAREDDGIMKVFCGFSENKAYTIAVYKTGQEIDVPIEKLRYIGLNRLWIIQELGLYTFVVEE